MTQVITWVARYKDGSIHTQYNADGSYRDKYADIVRDKLAYFELWTHNTHRLLLRVHFDSPLKKLIYRRRVFMHSDGTEHTIYLVGWQMKIGRQNVQSISVLFDDGHVENIGRWSEEGESSFYLFEKPIVHHNEGEDWE